jgi:hypothetical protein
MIDQLICMVQSTPFKDEADGLAMPSKQVNRSAGNVRVR